MRKAVLSYQKGSYRKTFIFILIIGFYWLIDSVVTKNIPSILTGLALCLSVLKQIVIPINLDQKVVSLKRYTKYNISDDDFINHYQYISNFNRNNIWHRLIILGDKVSSFLFISGILCSLFI